MKPSIGHLFVPSSIAIVGASSDRDKVGGKLLYGLQDSGYRGQIYPVNPHYSQLVDRPCFSSLKDIPDTPELVLLSIPRKAVHRQLSLAARIGIPSAIVYAAGYSETGSEGVSAQWELTALAERTGMRILGPNCQGFVNFHDHIMANWSSAFEVSPLKQGSVAFVSQSGAMIGFTYPEALLLGLGFSFVVSTGNEADIDLFECIEWLAADPHTRIIMAYLESIRHLDRFWRAAESAHRAGKPIVILKSGRSFRGRQAAASHTGALASDDRLYDSLFEQAGMLRVDDIEELLATVYLLQHGKTMAGPNLGVLTNSGGMGALIVDQAQTLGLSIPLLDSAIENQLRAALPPFAATANPVDTVQSFSDPDNISLLTTPLLHEAPLDAVLIFIGMAQMGTSYPLSLMVRALARVSASASRLLVVVWLGGSREAIGALRRFNVPVLTNPTVALKALRRMFQYSQWAQSSPPSRSVQWLPPEPLEVRLPFNLSDPSLRWSTPAGPTLALLEQVGISVSPFVRITDPTDVLKATHRLGYPVAIKVDSPHFLHKSDVGGVVLHVMDDFSARQAADRLWTIVESHGITDDVAILVQKMAPMGFEMLLGIKTDAALGSFVLVGSGGIYADILNDVVVAPAPLTWDNAQNLVRRLRSYRLLEGARGQPPSDIEALVDTLYAVSQLARPTQDGTMIQELDINPLIVYARGEGCLALDARAIWKRS